ncbi:MAG: bifunctional UDP-N-acetylglucosamine diphosphorylase/glucosamine-1-phosphate N-acetyltransferase GlmU, partial [Alphaproteobacteria bacterium]|nr:bifunctional UDP-N-acetylglucosamine diphosphorylase/glucosamine-1-phosphate N-acetyltransferase GlmU [Alphaproteobacteria bacterium]
PETVYFSIDTDIAPGCFIEANVVFGRRVRIAQATRILAFSHIESTSIGKHCQIGPFSRIRPNSQLEDDVKVGNFVEIKHSHIQTHTRANHHAYLGDCFIEPKVNIGAGTITCNYDGQFKHVTHIGENAFIGTNTSLVAPLVIGKDCIVGAGSVIADDVAQGDLAIERNKQVNIKDGARRLRERARKN